MKIMYVATLLLCITLAARNASAQEECPDADVNLDLIVVAEDEESTLPPLDAAEIEALTIDFEYSWTWVEALVEEFCGITDYPIEETSRMLLEEEERNLAIKLCNKCTNASNFRRCIKNR